MLSRRTLATKAPSLANKWYQCADLAALAKTAAKWVAIRWWRPTTVFKITSKPKVASSFWRRGCHRETSRTIRLIKGKCGNPKVRVIARNTLTAVPISHNICLNHQERASSRSLIKMGRIIQIKIRTSGELLCPSKTASNKFAKARVISNSLINQSVKNYRRARSNSRPLRELNKRSMTRTKILLGVQVL